MSRVELIIMVSPWKDRAVRDEWDAKKNYRTLLSSFIHATIRSGAFPWIWTPQVVSDPADAGTDEHDLLVQDSLRATMPVAKEIVWRIEKSGIWNLSPDHALLGGAANGMVEYFAKPENWPSVSAETVDGVARESRSAQPFFFAALEDVVPANLLGLLLAANGPAVLERFLPLAVQHVRSHRFQTP